MISHSRKPSIRAHAYELLARHLPDYHPSKHDILKDASMIRAGEYGEQRIDQFLQQFSSPEFLIALNLTLPYEGETIQLDHLVITPFFALTIETKHLKGHIKLDYENGHMFRNESDNSLSTWVHPSVQAERHQAGLLSLFKKIKVDLPVYSLIPFTHSSAHLEAVGTTTLLPKNLFRAERFTMKLRELIETNCDRLYENAELNNIANYIISYEVTEKIYDVRKKYNLCSDSLKSGVWCHACEQLSAEWISQRFRCNLCGEPCDESYLDSLYVYLTFISPTISNRQARNLLKGCNADTVRYLLHKADLVPMYKTSKRVYKLRVSHRED
ncbi:nuclease-related domain-containing protein [Jeotgalibacillus sp. JSM ZJ347]|uniref:nuclease-related domain-containing protein n=1 Tax=Jeotgalibacillus sp. JSM ZJ347 TaxID=3342117 RepID=UPI0035A8D189